MAPNPRTLGSLLMLALLACGCQADAPKLIQDVRELGESKPKQLHRGEPKDGLRIGLAYDHVRDCRNESTIVFRVVLENVSDQTIKVLDPEYYTGGDLRGSSPLVVTVDGERRGPALISVGNFTPLRAFVELPAGESLIREATIDLDWWPTLKVPFSADFVYTYELKGEDAGLVYRKPRWLFDEDFDFVPVKGLWKGRIESGVVRLDVR